MKLIDKYMPADYHDSVSEQIRCVEPLTPCTIFERMFCHFPSLVVLLMKLRIVAVKPYGLQTGGSFLDLITERNDEEVIACKDDKHLCFLISIYCSQPVNGVQEASVTTLVKFHNLFGRLYFALIWAFHKMLTKTLFNKALSKR